MKNLKTFGILLSSILIALILIDTKWAKDFIFGFLLEMFNLFNQHFSLNLILKKQRNIIATHWLLYITRYSLYGGLFALYVFKTNPNVLIIFIGIFAAKVFGILLELNRLKGGGECVRR
ncbi:hypothetical protein ABG79_00547 [Caloramator mitchellensis]|uniref:ATP synthase I chain n=1 Tax=Caloramator mitchellensis TaxID=908809 RepID=A0A0R3K2F5_CALMK|nr:hypothetical protein [Caloramator mitchellensis]KRQ87742.1 hypothetical protein ABG79_00547 [Caloramator mitchellensis]